MSQRSKWQANIQRVARLLTVLAPGLYAGRVLSELVQPQWPIAVAITLALTLIGLYLLHRRVSHQTVWTALPLYAYVLYPRPHLGQALAAAAVAILSAGLLHRNRLAAPPGARRPLVTRLLAAFVFLTSFALYRYTLAPGLLSADNGELQLVAARLGVAHPPGFALYTMLAHLATRLPLGPDAAFRVNWLSTLIAAATLTLLFLSAHHLTRSHISGLIAATALGAASTFWSQATTANVRMLAAFFVALAIYLLLLYRQQIASVKAPAQHDNPDRRRRDRLTFAFALTLALGVTHHASLIFIALVLALAFFWLDPTLLHRPRRWAAPLAGLLLGLLPLLYFPIRALTAAAGVRGVSPSLATLPGFLQHILALGFRGDLFAFTAPQELAPRLQVMGNVMAFQFHWLLLAAMVLGFVLLLRCQPKMALALGASYTLHTLVTATYRAPQTVEYMLPAYVPAALLLGAAAAPLSARRVPPQAARTGRALLSATLFVIALAQGAQRWPSFLQLSQDQTTAAYTDRILAQAPANSVVLAAWHWATPLWYMQEVAGQRPDLDIHYVFPTAEPYAETWARRIQEELAQGKTVVATYFDGEAFATLPPPQPLGDAFLFSQEPLLALPPGYTPLQHTLGGQIDLAGYQLSDGPLIPLQESVITLAWHPRDAESLPPVTLFVHLVDERSGMIYAQQDIASQPSSTGLTLTQLRFTPRLDAAPGDYQLFFGAYENANARPLPAGDGATRILLQLVPLQEMPRAPFTAHPIAMRSGQPRLIGYDWDNTLPSQTRLYLHWRVSGGYVTEVIDNPSPDTPLSPIPGPWGIARVNFIDGLASYVPLGAGIVWNGDAQLASDPPASGNKVSLVQRFAAARPLQQDLVVSVRLIGYEPDNIHWAWWDLHDTVPALGAIPTLKWIDGSRVRDPHFLTVSPGAPSGQTLGALVTLYDAFTQRSLPILDERITAQHPGIPLQASHVR